LTSDGSPQDERAISVVAASLKDHSLIHLHGQTKTNGSLVMEFLQGYEALAGPPSMETCSRDVYPDDRRLTPISEDFAWTIAMNLLGVLQKLHQKGICHGDFYGHNILISTATQQVKLSDFGAAFFYDPSSAYGPLIQQVELRSYAVLVEELQTLVAAASTTNTTPQTISRMRWNELVNACQSPSATFDGLVQQFP
jgi:serine/threonine protein kinase